MCIYSTTDVAGCRDDEHVSRVSLMPENVNLGCWAWNGTPPCSWSFSASWFFHAGTCVLWRHLHHPYISTCFCGKRFYSLLAISIKRSAKRLFTNSSREHRRIETKLSQLSDAVSDLDLRGSACVNKLLPRSARRKTLNRPTAILDLRRNYTVFRARSYACKAKEKPQRLFTNSSRERRQIATKLFQPSNTVPDLDLRGSACVNKLLPRSARRRNQPSAILDFRRWFAEER